MVKPFRARADIAKLIGGRASYNMADDQKPKTMDINDLVRELSKSPTTPATPSPVPQPPRPSFPTPKPPPPAGGPVPPMTSFSPAPAVPKPPTPSAPATVPKPEIPRPQFTPSPLPSQPKPAVPPVPPSAPSVKEYQSSIRTMNEDISKLKQGQQPAGVNIPRKVEQVIPVPQPQPAIPKPPSVPSSGGGPAPQFKAPNVSFGAPSKPAPMAVPKPITPPLVSRPVMPVPKVEPKPQIYVPPEKQLPDNRNILFITIGAVVVVAGLAYWFFVLRIPTPEIVVETPTPVPSQTPTPAPLPFEKLGVSDKVTIPSTSVFASALVTELNARQPLAGQIRLYELIDENQQKYSFKDFLAKLLIDTLALNDSGLLDTKEWVLGSYGQIAATGGSAGRLFIVLTQNDPNLATNIMTAWEPKLISDMTGLFGLTKTKAKLSFASDVYSNVNFRFVRIPDKDLGVAYAIFQNYLVFGSSRDSFRAVIDSLSTP